MKKVSQLDEYLFDLNGYLIIENALSKKELKDLNNILDKLKSLKDIRVSLTISEHTGREICSINTIDREEIEFLNKGLYKIQISFPHLRLLPGSYTIDLGIKTGKLDQDYINQAAIINIDMTKKDSHLNIHKRKGIISPKIKFGLENIK